VPDTLAGLTLTLFGEITNESVKPLLSKLLPHPKDQPVTIFINSEGGELYPALALSDTLLCYNTTAVGFGQVSSAATVVFLAAQKRYIARHAQILLHEMEWYYGDSVELSKAKHQYAAHSAASSRVRDFYLERTSLTTVQLDSLIREESVIGPTEIIKYGMADELWNGQHLRKAVSNASNMEETSS